MIKIIFLFSNFLTNYNFNMTLSLSAAVRSYFDNKQLFIFSFRNHLLSGYAVGKVFYLHESIFNSFILCPWKKEKVIRII